MMGGSLRDLWMNLGVLVLYSSICSAVRLKLFRFKEA